MAKAVDKKYSIKNFRIGSVLVPSQHNLEGEYEVTLMRCACPHFKVSHRGVDACKHILSAMAVLLIEAGWQVTPPSDWDAWNES